MQRPISGPRAIEGGLDAVLRARAEMHPDRIAFTFEDEGGRDANEPMSYRALDSRARAIAALLRDHGARSDPVLLVYRPGLDFIAAFFGCLYAGAIAVPCPAPRRRRPADRLRSIVFDCRPRRVLTTSALAEDLHERRAEIAPLQEATIHSTEALSPRGDSNRLEAGADDAPAFLQYTSGSTADPKGVIVSRGNLAANSRRIAECFGSHEGSRGVFWLPLHHDMGLIGGVLQTVFCGGTSTLMPPTAFIQRPLRWLEAISRTGATISGGPDFAYALCARKITPEQCPSLDLSRWEVAFNGAEPVRPETLVRFSETFAPCGFRREAFLPCYGLAEATLLVSGSRDPEGPRILRVSARELERGIVVETQEAEPGVRSLVACGRPVADSAVLIAEPEAELSLLPDERVGEIVVAGPSVALGYRGHDEASRRSFPELSDGRRALRTGDLGFLHDGRLFVTGRLKDLLIVRGRNLHPQDIESVVEGLHPALRASGAAAFSVDVGEESGIIVAAEVERNPDASVAGAVIQSIRENVAEEFEIELAGVALLKPLTLPRTSSGKLRRSACRDAYSAGTLEPVAEWRDQSGSTPVEEQNAQSLSIDAGSREIADWLAARIARLVGASAESIDRDRPFAAFGLGSVQAVALAGELEERLYRSLPATLVYDHPTIESLARHLAGEAGGTPAGAAEKPDEAIAIIGVGCRFPGASGPVEFLRLLSEGRDAIASASHSREEFHAFDPASGRAPCGMTIDVTRGGFLDDVAGFDAAFFGIAPREAAAIDPQQRLLLETTWEAMEDAGLPASSLRGTSTGVFVGISNSDYRRLWEAATGASGEYGLTGNAASIAANRLSYAFDLRGPSLAVDTACSSSLVAVHMACRSLRSGESSIALAAGANLLLDPEVSAAFARSGFLSPRGRCAVFSAEADGYVRGEGVGVVVLKPLRRAIADGDRVYAVIRGSAVNQDGRSNGLTAPNGPAQEAVVRAALRSAGVCPAELSYVEAHGTGTALGDPIELQALASVLGEDRPADRPCFVGSVKSNIGHLEAAAGIAGLIKTALMLHDGRLVPTLHSDPPNPRVPFGESPLRVASRGELPNLAESAIAGVSSFGFGGTNAHVVLGRAPEPTVPRDERPANPRSILPLPISAATDEALRERATGLRKFLESHADVEAIDIAWSAGARTEHADVRMAVAGSTTEEWLEAIDAFLASREHPRLWTGRKPAGRSPDVCFVFSGQGGLHAGAGLHLEQSEPVFREAFSACREVIASEQGRASDPDTLFDAPEITADPESAQPLQFAIQTALAAQLIHWGVEPRSVVGHSLGEIAAAHVAGALRLADAARIVRLRGALMKRCATAGMTAVAALDAAELERRFLADRGLTVAAINSPRQTTFSGPPAAVAAAVDHLKQEGVFARVIDAAFAFHGSEMDPVREKLTQELGEVACAPSRVAFHSTVEGAAVDGRFLNAEYWGRNVRYPVRFADTLRAIMTAERGTVFVEMGPHPIHVAAIRAIAEAANGSASVALATLRREMEDGEALMRLVAALYVTGVNIAWGRVQRPGEFVRLPGHPWNHERFWVRPSARKLNGRNIGLHRHAPRPSTNGHAGSGALSLVAPAPTLGAPAFTLKWSDEPRIVERILSRDESWRVVADDSGLRDRLVKSLEKVGVHVRSVPFDYTEWDEPRDRNGQVSTGCTNLLAAFEPTAEPASACLRLMRLAQHGEALHGSGRPVRLSLVTIGAQFVPVGATPISVSSSALWGLGRCLALSHPQIWGGMVDLDPSVGVDGGAAFLRDLSAGEPAEGVVYRSGRRYVARLAARSADDESPDRLQLRPDGTYLITGGLGALGLKSAEWLADRGARRLVLVGRSGLPPRSVWDSPPDDRARAAFDAIRRLESSGATVTVRAVDVGSTSRIEALLRELSDQLPPLRGVIHAAGVVRSDATTANETVLTETLASKLTGAKALDRLTADLPLDFFVMYSSLLGLSGSPRLGAYAASNAGLDALAHDRRRRGLPALSIAWGAWSDGGMATNDEWRRSLELLGIRPLDPMAAFATLERLMLDGTTHAVVAEADWDRFSRALGASANGRVFEEIRSPESRLSPKSVEPLTIAAISDLVLSRVAATLGLPRERLDADRSLTDLGLDSLMAMELKAGVEGELGISLPLSQLLDGPSTSRLVERLIEARRSRPDGAPIPSGDDAGPDDRASTAQEAIWFAHKLTPTPQCYTIAGAVMLRGQVDVRAVRRAVERLVRRHDALRMRFPACDGGPIVVIGDFREDQFQHVHLPGVDDDALKHAVSAEAARPIDPETGPVFRIRLWSRSEEQRALLMAMHHIVGDFWTTAILVDEFGRLYLEEIGRSTDSPLPPAPSFRAFTHEQRRRLEGPEGEALREYWRGRLGNPPILELPTARPRPVLMSGRGSVRRIRLGRTATGPLLAQAQRHDTSPFAFLVTAFAIWLSRLSGQDELIVGTPMAARTRPGTEALVGYLTNLIPIRIDLRNLSTFSDALAHVTRVAREAMDHQELPYAEAIRTAALPSDASRPPLLQVLFIHQKAQRLRDQGLTPFALSAAGNVLEIGGLRLESLEHHSGGSPFELTMMSAEHGGRLEFSLEYATDLFDAETVDHWLGAFTRLIECVAADPETQIEAIALEPPPTAPDRETTAEYKTVHSIVEARALATPNQPAVIAAGRSFTYRELMDASDRLATHLVECGLRVGEPVGLCAMRSIETFVGLLGILKAGGCYVPLDPSLPSARLETILHDARPSLVVIDEASSAEILPHGTPTVLAFVQADSNGAAPLPNLGPNDAAYVVYTSGSTGRPKGVVVTHGGLVALYRAWEREYRIADPPGRHLQMAGLGFDVFAGDWVRALGSGGTLVVCARVTLLDPKALLNLIDRERIEFAEFVPATASSLMDELERGGRTLESLRLVAVGSDTWHLGEHRRLRRLVGPTTRVVNSYGLTEATIDTTFFEGDLPGAGDDVVTPIGRPMNGLAAYVLDHKLRQVPVGASGEIYVAGPGVARGYLGRPDLTAERFLPDPFGLPGTRMYRTGDIGRRRIDGNIALTGRADHQVKIRGHRIELGEVESSLLRLDGVAEAVVETYVDGDGVRRLAAFVVPRGTSPLAPDELRRRLRERLPDAMVPFTIRLLDALPLGANGKLDRGALIVAGPDDDTDIVEQSHRPLSPVEERLASIIADVVGSRPTTDVNLFELGVDSIQAIRIATRLRDAGMSIGPGDLFKHPSIAGLAALIDAEPMNVEGPAIVPAASVPLPAWWREEIGSEIDIEDWYDLTPVQEGMLYHVTAEPESGLYIDQFSCILHGTLDEAAFNAAWRQVTRRHPALRTSIHWAEASRPIQVVHRDIEPPIAREDWREVDASIFEERFEAFREADMRRGFVPSWAPLHRTTLIRLADDKHRLLWTCHHLVFDGWSLPIVLDDFLTAYEAAAADAPISLRPAVPFRRYVEHLSTRDLEGSREFWRRKLAGLHEPTRYGFEREKVARSEPIREFDELDIVIEEASVTALNAAARAARVTPATVLQAAWALAASRCSGREDMTFGVTVSGRPADLRGVESMVGPMINTLPWRARVDEWTRLRVWLDLCGRELRSIHEHEDTPPLILHGCSEFAPGVPLFETILIVQNTPTSAVRAQSLVVEQPRVHERTNFPLAITILPGPPLVVRAVFDRSVFAQEDIRSLLAYYEAILRRIPDSLDRPLVELRPASDEADEAALLERRLDEELAEALRLADTDADAVDGTDDGVHGRSTS